MAKKTKTIKKVPAKKLPKILKKEYSPELFDKKILKKIYIDTDKKLIKSLFVEGKDKKGNKVLHIDISSSLEKSDFARAKTVAKAIKAQKSSVKLIPLMATLVFVCALLLFTLLFKNAIVKSVITSSMQKIFLAKTDIEKVDLKLLSASLEIDSLAQADKDSPMRNLFEIDKIHMDFDFVDLLKGKFHAENMEISGVALATERKTSGELVFAASSGEVKKAEKEVEKNSRQYSKNAAKALQEMFKSYDPQTMLSGIQDELKSPKLAESISADVTSKVEKWKNLPAEYHDSVSKITDNVNAIANTDWSKVNDPVKIAATLEKIAQIYKETDSVKSRINETTSSMTSDAAAIKEYSSQIQAAIKSDTLLLDSKITEMKKTFSPTGLKGVMNDALNSVLYSAAGKYYPYANMALNAAMNAKGSDKSAAKANKAEKQNEPKEEKSAKSKKVKKSHKRSSGRDIFYRKDNVPRFLIETVKASGYEYKTDKLLFEASANEISSDQNMRGKASSVNASFKAGGSWNKLSATVDARSDSQANLILAKYSGKGFPVQADAEVFTLNSDSLISASMTADDDGSFTIGGTMDLKVKDISGMDFSPEKLSKLYNKSLQEISNLTLGFTLSSGSEGLSLKITNLDKLSNQMLAPISKALSSELNSIADDAKKEVSALLKEKNGAVTSSISEFAGIQSSLNKELSSVNNLEKILNQKKKELAAKSGASAAQDAANKLLNKLF